MWKEAVEALLARIQEMRATMETFASDAAKAGVNDLSFGEWRKALDQQEEALRLNLRGGK